MINKTHLLIAAMLFSAVASTSIASAQDRGIALRGKHQLGFDLGAYSTNESSAYEDGYFRSDSSSTSPSAFVRYQYWFSDQAAVTVQTGVLDSEVDFEFEDDDDHWRMRSSDFSLVPILVGMQFKPFAFETSGRSFFAIDIAAGPYVVSGTEYRHRHHSRTKSETVFGGCAGISHHWFLTDHLLLSINARYHVTGDFDKKLYGIENGTGFNGTVGLAWMW